MAKLIPSHGNRHPRLFIIGERPGIEEYYAGENFVGPAGQELFGTDYELGRLERVTGVTRDECYIANLVPVFSPKPPTDEEVAQYADLLLAALLKIRPPLIVTIGTHAARHFLPQFRGTPIETFHGLAYPVRIGRMKPFDSVLVPVVHSAAALRQPGLYQNLFTAGLRGVAHALDTRIHLDSVLHRPRPLAPLVIPCGLATLIAQAPLSPAVGLDTEGNADVLDSECITLSASGMDACLVDLTCGDTPGKLHFTQMALDKAQRLTIHTATHDVKVLHKRGLHIDYRKLDCTMLMAFYADMPQGLKPLCFRLFGYQMSTFMDMIAPLDDALVRRTLRGCYEEAQGQYLRFGQALKAWKAARRAAKKARLAARAQRRRERLARQSGAAARVDGSGHRRLQDGRRSDAHGECAAPDVQVAEPQVPAFPKRALTTLSKLLSTPTDDTLRQRWQRSTFALAIPLPPEPTWKDIPQHQREPYALADSVGHREAREVLWPRVVASGQARAYRIDMAELPMIIRNEEVGLACDADALRALSTEFEADYRSICARIDALAGHPVNPNSQPQVADTLFAELGIRPTRKSKKTGHFTTADKYLKARRSEHDIVQLVLSARQLNKYLGTYTRKLPEMLQRPPHWHPHYQSKHWRRVYRETPRYFPEWKYTRTTSGRRAEEVILLIPKHDPMAKTEGRPNRAKQIRNCFHATEGHTLVSVDLSQIELRVMADNSQDKRMLHAFLNGIDYHAQVAADLLGAPREKEKQDESAHRLPAKTINFGIINGMTEYGMLDQLHEAGQLQWTLESIQELLDEWFHVHKGVDAMFQRQIKFARDHGYVVDMFGARRTLTAIWSTDEKIVREAERQALHPIQAGADRISKVWGRKIYKQVIERAWRRGDYCEPWVRVHDDTTLEVDTRIAADVQRDMLALVPDLLSVPTLAEGKSGIQWGELH